MEERKTMNIVRTKGQDSNRRFSTVKVEVILASVCGNTWNKTVGVIAV